MLCCSQLTKLLASDHRNQLRMVQQLSVNATASNKSFCLLTSAALAACVITLYCTLQRPGLQQGTRDNVRLSIDGTFGTGRREGVWSSPADKRTIFSFTLASVDDLAMKIEKNYSRARDCNAVSFGSGWGENKHHWWPDRLVTPAHFDSSQTRKALSVNDALVLFVPRRAHPVQPQEPAATMLLLFLWHCQ